MKAGLIYFMIGPSYIHIARMKKQFIYFLFVCTACLLACSNPVDPNALELNPSEINRLIPFRGELNNGVRQLYPEEPYKAFWAENWNTPEQSIVWKVNTGGEEYQAAMLVSVNHLEKGEEAVLTLSNGTDSVVCRIGTTGWQSVAVFHDLYILIKALLNCH